MPPPWTPEQAEAFSRYFRGLEARYSELAEVLASPDIGLDTFHLDGINEYAGDVYDAARQLAVVPIDDADKVRDLLFDVQWAADRLRRQHIRPFTLRFNGMLLQVEAMPGDQPASSPSAAVLADLQEFWQAIEDRLRGVGVRRRAENKALHIVALAASCLQARREVESMVGSTAPPLEELWRVLAAAERVGWWIDETYPWLHALVLRLLDGDGETQDESILRGIKNKAAEWQRLQNKIKAVDQGAGEKMPE